MFGNNNQSDNQIPEDSIEGALRSDDNQNESQKDWGHPGTPIDDSSSASPSEPTDTPDDDSSDATSDVIVAASPVTSADEHHNQPTNDLIDIKQKALNQLSPLVGHLDQTPEEKFRTTMMMIQASDNQKLIPVAYEAANAIPDEKAKAQALLDIVNEINYFTSQHQS